MEIKAGLESKNNKNPDHSKVEQQNARAGNYSDQFEMSFNAVCMG